MLIIMKRTGQSESKIEGAQNLLLDTSSILHTLSLQKMLHAEQTVADSRCHAGLGVPHVPDLLGRLGRLDVVIEVRAPLLGQSRGKSAGFESTRFRVAAKRKASQMPLRASFLMAKQRSHLGQARVHQACIDILVMFNAASYPNK